MRLLTNQLQNFIIQYVNTSPS